MTFWHKNYRRLSKCWRQRINITYTKHPIHLLFCLIISDHWGEYPRLCKKETWLFCGIGQWETVDYKLLMLPFFNLFKTDFLVTMWRFIHRGWDTFQFFLSPFHKSQFELLKRIFEFNNFIMFLNKKMYRWNKKYQEKQHTHIFAPFPNSFEIVKMFPLKTS